MRFFASASSSSLIASGTLASKSRTPTSSSSASGIWPVAWIGFSLGSGSVSLVTQAPSPNANVASSDAANHGR